MTVKDRLYAVLRAEADAIRSVVVTDSYERAARVIADATGKIVAVGMGKAGILAQKFAATLCSTGTPAVFLHPGEAAHGDLGVLTSDDVIVVFSTSGKTAEVLEMLEAAQRWQPYVIGITSHPDSRFRELCHLVLEMGVIDEPCPLGLTPSASSAVMLAIGDALALAALELKGITRADFGARHRRGYLGEKAWAGR